MSILDDLASLPVLPEFDSPDTEDYPDPTGFTPIPEGTYRMKIVEWELDKKKDGTPNLTRDQYPVILLKKVEVVEPAEYAGRVASMFQRVYSSEFTRNGVEGASQLKDLVRSHDQTIHFQNTRDRLEGLHQMVEGGTTFRGKVIWTGYDKDAVEQGFAEIGGKSMASKEQAKAIYARGKIKGMKKFPKQADGKYAGTMTGPSGASVEARSEIGSFVPSGADQKLG